MKRERFLGLIGIAKKAGKLVLGTSMVRSSIQKGKKPALCVISDGCSENTMKRMLGCCEHYGVQYIVAQISTEELGKAVGAGELSCIGIYDDGFAKAVLESVALL